MDNTNTFLSKKERKQAKKELEKQQQTKERSTNDMIKWTIISFIIILVAAGGWFLFKQGNKPLPGVQFEMQGRQHVPQEEWSKFPYNSNPPTSGPHDEVWTKPGIYEIPQGDGHLVHSLEHGYIVISYNCNIPGTDCEALKKQLSDLANRKELWKLIVVPRENLDARIAVAAWTRVDKMDTFDEGRIVSFIDAFRNHGPEATME